MKQHDEHLLPSSVCSVCLKFEACFGLHFPFHHGCCNIINLGSMQFCSIYKILNLACVGQFVTLLG